MVAIDVPEIPELFSITPPTSQRTNKELKYFTKVLNMMWFMFRTFHLPRRQLTGENLPVHLTSHRKRICTSHHILHQFSLTYSSIVHEKLHPHYSQNQSTPHYSFLGTNAPSGCSKRKKRLNKRFSRCQDVNLRLERFIDINKQKPLLPLPHRSSMNREKKWIKMTDRWHLNNVTANGVTNHLQSHSEGRRRKNSAPPLVE